MLAVTGDDNKLAILHQIKNFGGTRTRPTSKFVALCGTSVDTKILNIEGASLLRFQNLWDPKEDEMLKCQSKEDADNCTAMDMAQYPLKVLPVVALPPLLVTLWLETEE